jgi:hypothetical protein
VEFRSSSSSTTGGIPPFPLHLSLPHSSLSEDALLRCVV